MTDAVAMALLALLLVTAAVCDMRTGKVFNSLTYSAVVVGLAWQTVAGAIDPQSTALVGLTDSALAMALGLVAFAIIFAAGGLGGGDVKTMAAVGAISASWQCVLATAFYGFVAGAIIAVILMIQRRVVKRTFSRLFGAALVYAGRSKVELPENTVRVPFALALCIGGLLAGVETLLDIRLPWSPVW